MKYALVPYCITNNLLQLEHSVLSVSWVGSSHHPTKRCLVCPDVPGKVVVRTQISWEVHWEGEVSTWLCQLETHNSLWDHIGWCSGEERNQVWRAGLECTSQLRYYSYHHRSGSMCMPCFQRDLQLTRNEFTVLLHQVHGGQLKGHLRYGAAERELRPESTHSFL